MKQYTASAIVRGRTLEPKAVDRALAVQSERREELLSRHRISLTSKECGEARRLTGRWDFWNYNKGVTIGGGR